MPSDITLDVGAGGAAVSLLTTELNALANGAASALSAAVDNATNLDARVWFELNGTFAATPTADSVVEVYVVYLNSDGTNYGDYSTTGPVLDPSTFVGNFVVRATTAAQRRVSPVVFLRARSFKVGVVNRSGVAMTASGHTLKAYYERDAST
jgi:hypothetical protein